MKSQDTIIVLSVIIIGLVTSLGIIVVYSDILDDDIIKAVDYDILDDDIIKSGTMESMVDPGLGHEYHQLAIILPPSEDVYSGILTYSASEPIQLVSLHGPLAEGEDKGQAIWTPDGETKFALTFVDNKASMGSWKFSGNALAVHTMKTDPFTVSYSVAAMQKDSSETGISDTITGDIDHITEIQIQALIQTHKIQSDLLEGVEEAFAYIILGDENEKNEFYHKMGDFANRVDMYIFFDIEFDDDDIEERETLDAISKAHTNLVASANIMFESFESGDLDMETVLTFEENIDEIVPLIDELIEDEMEDITEHLQEIEEKINDSSADD